MSWFDRLVGARLRHQFSPGLNFFVSGDVGGFDVGSKFSWQVLAAVDYEFCRSSSGLTLYQFDMTMHGPIFGVTARF